MKQPSYGELLQEGARGFKRFWLSSLTTSTETPWRFFLLTLALFAILLDGMTTVALLRSPAFVEANPLVAAPMAVVGVLPWAAFITLLCLPIASLVAARPARFEERLVVAWAWVIVGGKLFVALSNSLLLAGR